MDATELSERIKQHLDAGEWAKAMAELAEAWKAASEFGVMVCDRPEYPGVWVKFQTSGYPFGLRRQWDDLKTDVEALGVILPRVVDWNVTDLAGTPVPLNGDREAARDAALLDNVDDGLVVWLIHAFTRFWRIELPQPRKN